MKLSTTKLRQIIKEELLKEELDPNFVADELTGIREEMIKLVKEAKQLIRNTKSYNSANSYWISIILGQLGEENYANPYDYTMLSTIEELEK